MFGIGYPELIVIFLLALIVLGPRKLPEIARAIGRGIRELQKVMHGLSEEVYRPPDNPPPPAAPRDPGQPAWPGKPRFLPDDPVPASPDTPTDSATAPSPNAATRDVSDSPAKDEQQDVPGAGSRS